MEGKKPTQSSSALRGLVRITSVSHRERSWSEGQSCRLESRPLAPLSLSAPLRTVASVLPFSFSANQLPWLLWSTRQRTRPLQLWGCNPSVPTPSFSRVTLMSQQSGVLPVPDPLMAAGWRLQGGFWKPTSEAPAAALCRPGGEFLEMEPAGGHPEQFSADSSPLKCLITIPSQRD